MNVRLLDPPLHEFVPHDLKGQEEMAQAMGVTVQEIQKRVESLCEHNPMLGHRGCRLGNTYPCITEMQTQAILGAAIELKREGYDPHPEIMVPLTGILYEFEAQEKVIRDAAAELFEREGMEIPFKVGTMIEIPRAALTANRIASRAEYFSFGTNDLTQMTFGYSRDDIASFLPVYLEKKILKVDPFQVLDQNGVGQLIEMAVDKGRSVRPDLKCGGMIWIEKSKDVNGSADFVMEINGAYRSPDFIVGSTDVTAWVEQLRTTTVPWLELRGRHVAFSVQRERLLDMINDDPIIAEKIQVSPYNPTLHIHSVYEWHPQ